MFREKLKETVNNVVDFETGELIESTRQSTHEMECFRKCTNDEFIMVYLKDLSGFLNIDNATQIKLLSII